MRIRVLGVLATAATLVPIGIAAVTPASAAAGGHARYVALAGDDDYLIYAEKVGTSPLNPVSLSPTANVYALGRTGKPMLMDKALTDPQVVSLSKSNLVIVNKFKHHNRVRSWNLATGQHTAIGTNEDVIGATPNGWISLDKGYVDGTHVIARSYSGDLTDYGNPITPGVDYGVTVGPHGFVAYADNFVNDNGEITYTPWAHPSVHRTLQAPGGKNVRCDSVSESYAACVIGGGVNRSVALISLSGHNRTTAGNRCAYQLSVWGSRLAWGIGIASHGCKTGHIGVTSLLGTTQLSKQRYNILGTTVAWNRVITSNAGQRSLVRLSSIHKAAKPLKRANV
ncbi:MAG TPA: hypothetical protein VHD81_06575 [Mycobacteriales bacterium]|nr:hypothetical protein [Mycobacteriales bacterium]